MFTNFISFKISSTAHIIRTVGLKRIFIFNLLKIKNRQNISKSSILETLFFYIYYIKKWKNVKNRLYKYIIISTNDL